MKDKMEYTEKQFEEDLKNNKVQLPDGNTFEICDSWIKALKEKGKKEKMTYEQMIKLMVIETAQLWDKGKSKDKFGETDLSERFNSLEPMRNMADSFECIFYSYIRFQIMKKMGGSLGIKVIDVNEMTKKLQEEN